jgi:hypothetical protein
VTATDTKRVDRHQPLDIDNNLFTPAPLDGFVRLDRASKPGHAVDGFNAVVAGRRLGSSPRKSAKGGASCPDRHRCRLHHQHVVAVENMTPLW